MFVALRHLKEQLPSGEVKDLYPGDPVTTFDSWPYNNKVSAISYRLVAKADEGVPVDANELLSRGPDPQVRASIAAQHGWDKRDFVPVHASAMRPAEVPEPQPQAPVAEVRADEAPADVTDDAELQKALGIERHSCDSCAYVATSAAGLKIHRSRQHKPS